MSQLRLSARSEGATLTVRVHPAAKRNAITGTHDGALKISLTTPPADGRANAALIAFLAVQLSIPRAHIELLTGHAARTKTPVSARPHTHRSRAAPRPLNCLRRHLTPACIRPLPQQRRRQQRHHHRHRQRLQKRQPAFIANSSTSLEMSPYYSA